MLDYGLEGYGLYWYCIELIAGKVDKDNITFDLEHDARIIAKNTGSTPQKVEEMMRYFVKTGLFEDSSGVITCFKLARRLDKSMTSNAEMRAIIDNLKNHDPIMTQSEKPMQDKIRSEEKRTEQTRVDNIKDLSPKVDVDESFEKVWKQYPSKQNKKKALATFTAYVKKKKLDVEDFADYLIKDICERCNSQQFGFDKLHFTTYMNGERWFDEITQNLSDADAKHEAWKRSIQETDYTDLLGE
jgi:uncharacterized protein YifE (UPF0438 family)